jgi:uncharacterized protein (TIGR02246 family)
MSALADEVKEVRGLLKRMDAALAGGDADGFGVLFTDDAQLLLLHREPIVGRQAISSYWRDFFGRFDTSAWRTDHARIEVDGVLAHAFSTYSETLVPHDGGPPRVVVGRIDALFRHLGADGWRITLLMNSHTRPVEQLA